MNVAGEVRAELRTTASAARAAAQKAYLKSDLRFMGVDQSAIRRVGTALARRVQAGHDAALREGAKYLPAKQRRALLGVR